MTRDEVEALRTRLGDVDFIQRNAFPLVKEICRLANEGNESLAQEMVLRALDNRESFGAAQSVVNGLARQFGLFPYLEAGDLGLADLIALEFHRPMNLEKEDIVFHRVQGEVYRELMSGKSVVLSAPTSFGKSLIIDAVIAAGVHRNVVIIVPTLALADETRRRLSKFSSQYKIITHGSQELSSKNILILTQERLLGCELPEEIDFFVIDEFYKLRADIDPERSTILNQAFYVLMKRSKQFYLLGPNVELVSSQFPERFRCVFIKTDYATVVSEVRRVSPSGDPLTALAALCGSLSEPTLIYCSSPKRVREVAEHLMQAIGLEPVPAMAAAVSWIGAEYHPEWVLAKALSVGIGIHHGKLPRSLAQYVVKGFNDGHLRFLVCSSTLIEGVNTKAKNVIVYDNSIAQQQFDYFTFNNIKGRSGRMFQHFVGRVFVFHEPPQPELPNVDLPVLTQGNDASDALLLQMDDSDLQPRARARVEPYLRQALLDPLVLKANVGVDPGMQLELAAALAKAPESASHYLSWRGTPSYDQLKFACELIWKYFIRSSRRRAGVSSGSQLTWKIMRLMREPNTRAVIKAAIAESPDKPGEAIEDLLDFLRQWPMFNLPRYLMAVSRIQQDVLGRANQKTGDFSSFVSRVECLFQDPVLFALDEYGIPIQVSAKLSSVIGGAADLDDVLMRLRRLDDRRLPLLGFEAELVSYAKKFI